MKSEISYPWVNPLSAEEEKQLIVSSQAGNRDATERLILSQQGWIVTLLKKWNLGADEDAIQNAMLACLRAIPLFRLEYGIRLSTWIFLPVKRSILATLKERRIIHVPPRAFLNSKGTLAFERVLLTENRHGAIDLFEAISLQDNSWKDHPLTACDIGIRALKSLSRNQRKILLLRRKGKNLREIGEILGVSRRRVQQIEQRTIRQLQIKMNTHSLDHAGEIHGR